MNITPRGDRFQLRVVNRLLPKPFYFTFDTREEAATYGGQLEGLLMRGIVPQDLADAPPTPTDRVVDVIDAYLLAAPVAPTDVEVFGVIGKEVVGVRIAGLTYRWVQEYVRRLKVERNLAPSTIRKRVEALGRVLAWHLNERGDGAAANPFRLLPKGYSTYSGEDSKLAGVVKKDLARTLRLPAQAEERVRWALGGGKRGDRERPWAVDPAFTLLFELVIDTGLRLKEAYTLRWDQVDIRRRLIMVEGSKGHRGALKPREVPLKAVLREKLVGGVGLVFPFWDGTDEDVKRASGRLSNRFSNLFTYCELPDLTEHDLRHEACCRWFELRDAAGRWVFSDVEICRIMGWSDYSMILTYASLRGEDLASRLL